MFVVGIAGSAGSGKDTFAGQFVRAGFHRYAFADPIKETILPLFGWDSRHGFGTLKDQVDPMWGVSPRHVFQTFGTEWAQRYVSKDFWVKIAARRLSGYKYVVIPDVRFEHEADWIRNNGVLIHIERPGLKRVNDHSSEDGVLMNLEDFYITNDGTVEDLRQQAKVHVEYFLDPNTKVPNV
jgi:hypothetical protein